MSDATWCKLCRKFFGERLCASCIEKIKGGKVYAEHSDYGCDCDCSGHMYYIETPGSEIIEYRFEFTHDKEEIMGELKHLADKYNLSIGECSLQTYDDGG